MNMRNTMAMTKTGYVKFGHDEVGCQPSTEEFNAERVSPSEKAPLMSLTGWPADS
jgi:hypothetical protein